MAILRNFRRPPRTVAGPDAMKAVMRVARDRRFQQIAGISAGRRDSFLKSLHQVGYRRDFAYYGGWAGWDDDGNCIIALPRRFIWHTHQAVVSHELFHYARHYNGETPFRRPDDPYSCWKVICEEFVVWGNSISYSPIGSILLLLPAAVIIVVAMWLSQQLTSALVSIWM